MNNKTNIEEDIKIVNQVLLHNRETKEVRQAIENILADRERLQNKVKELEKENTDIKDVYIRTAKHLDKKGMLELSEYLLAQIEATPTFTTWEEYTTWISKQVIRDKIEELKRKREPIYRKDQIRLNFIYNKTAKISEEELDISNENSRFLGKISALQELLDTEK